MKQPSEPSVECKSALRARGGLGPSEQPLGYRFLGTELCTSRGHTIRSNSQTSVSEDVGCFVQSIPYYIHIRACNKLLAEIQGTNT